MTPFKDVPDWREGLPQEFLRLCDKFQVVHKAHARVLAIALRKSQGQLIDVATDGPSAEEIDSIVSALSADPPSVLSQTGPEFVGGAVIPPQHVSQMYGMRGFGVGEIPLSEIESDQSLDELTPQPKTGEGGDDEN